MGILVHIPYPGAKKSGSFNSIPYSANVSWLKSQFISKRIKVLLACVVINTMIIEIVKLLVIAIMIILVITIINNSKL